MGRGEISDPFPLQFVRSFRGYACPWFALEKSQKQEAHIVLEIIK